MLTAVHLLLRDYISPGRAVLKARPKGHYPKGIRYGKMVDSASTASRLGNMHFFFISFCPNITVMLS